VVVPVCFVTNPPTDTDAAGLVGFHREQVTYADVTDASGAQPSSVQLTAEETDAVYALLDAMQYKRLGAASAMQDCYARLYFISAAGERCEVILSEREMLVNPITGGKTARLYELRSESTELRDYLLGCIGTSDAAPEQMSHPTLSDDLTEAERSIVDEFLHWAQGLRAEDILNLQFHDGSSSRFLVDAEQTALSAQLVPALNALSEAELYTQQGYGDSTYYTLTVNLRDGTDYIFLCGFDCVRLLHPTFEPSLSSSYPSSRPTLWIDSPALMACINSLHSPPTPLPDPETVAGHSDAVSTTGYATYDALLAEISGLRRSGASEAQTDFSHDLLSANDYYQTPGWLLRDLDGDEIPELLLGADWGDGHSVIFNIYRLDGAKAVRVVDGWNRNRWYLCTDGSLANEGSSSAFESSYSYYRYTSGELQHLETLLYLDGGSGGSPWRYSATADHYVSSGDFRSVTEAEATAVRDKYTHETLILTPFVV